MFLEKYCIKIDNVFFRGVVVAVVTIVGLVLYFSQRNFKRRSNVHRRRWLESDLTIDNYSDGMVYTKNILQLQL